MLWDILNVVLLLPLVYYAWKQQGEIDDLKMMVGYVLTVIEEEEEDVSPDY
jgi:RNAse (barnase) inhibitor barstar